MNSESPKPMRLKDLVQEPSLGLSWVASPNGRARILGAHVIEVPRPTRWVGSGWLVLFAGTRFPNMSDPEAEQREVVRELKAHGVAALAFGSGDVYEQIPTPIVEECISVGLPLLDVEHRVPFRDIVNFVNQGALSIDTIVLRRSLWLHQQLLDAVGAVNPEQMVISTIAQWLQAGAALLDERGISLISHGKLPLNALAELSKRHADWHTDLVWDTIGRWEIASQIVTLDHSHYRLLIATQSRSSIEDLAPAALKTASQLLSAVSSLERGRELELNELHQGLFEMLRKGTEPEAESKTWRMLEDQGFTRNQPMHVFTGSWAKKLIEEEDQSRTSKMVPRRHMLQAARSWGIPLILTRSETVWHGIAAAPQNTLEALLRSIDPDFVGGIGPQLTRIHDFPMSLLLADQCWHWGSQANDDFRRVVSFDSLTLTDRLIVSQNDASLKSAAHQLLAPILDHEHLLLALVTYMRHGFHTATAAKELHLHENSLRYRLRRIESLLSTSLRDPKSVSDLCIGLSALGYNFDQKV